MQRLDLDLLARVSDPFQAVPVAAQRLGIADGDLAARADWGAAVLGARRCDILAGRKRATMGIRYSKPPVLLHDVVEDVSEVVRLLESQAPDAPLGGWYNPGADPRARTRPMWFQQDWVHDTFRAEGSDLFLRHPLSVEAAKRFYDAEVAEPQRVYANVMTSIADGGPAHTDNPRLRGRDRRTRRCGCCEQCCGPGSSSASRSIRPP